MLRINKVSDICEMEIRILGCSTAKVPLNASLDPKSSRKGFPNALVICNAAPSNIEKTKKMAICFLRNKTKASSPRVVNQEAVLLTPAGLQAGMVKQYKLSTMDAAPLTRNCIGVCVQLNKSTSHMAQINPTVPHTGLVENLLQC